MKKKKALKKYNIPWIEKEIEWLSTEAKAELEELESVYGFEAERLKGLIKLMPTLMGASAWTFGQIAKENEKLRRKK